MMKRTINLFIILLLISGIAIIGKNQLLKTTIRAQETQMESDIDYEKENEVLPDSLVTPRALVNDPNYIGQPGERVPAEYVFGFKNANINSVSGFGTTITNGHENHLKGLEMRNAPKGKIGVLYKNVDSYNGQSVDVKLTFLNWKNTSTDNRGIIQFRQNGFGIDFLRIKDVDMKYEFFKAGTTTPIKVKGYFTYADLDMQEVFRIANIKTLNTWKKMYMHEPHKLVYGIENNDFVAYPQDPNLNASNENSPEHFVTGTYDATSLTLRHTYPDLTGPTVYPNPTWLNGSSTFVSSRYKARPTELGSLSKTVSDNDQTNVVNNKISNKSETVTYRINTSVPYEYNLFHYKSYIISDTIPKGFSISSAAVFETGTTTNVTNKFDIYRLNGSATATGEVRATLKAASNVQAFYGKNYTMEIKGTFNNLLAEYWKTNKYQIPNKANVKAVNKQNTTFNINSNQTLTDVGVVPKITKTVKNITENTPAAHGANADFKFGDELEFKIVLTSPDGNLANAIVTDQMPTGLTITSWSLNGVNKALTGVVSNKLNSIYAATHVKGATHTVLIRAKAATSGLTNAQKLTNTASLSSTGNSNVAASATATHYLPAHKITKAANNVSGTAVGTTASKLSWQTEFFYDITYTNTSTKGFTNPTITDTLPVGINASSRNIQYKLNGAAAWTNHTGNLISADLRTLNTGASFAGIQPGKTLVIRIPVKATSAVAVQGKSFTNTASAIAKYSLIAATVTKTNVANINGSAIVNYLAPNLTVTKQVRNNTEKIPTTGYTASTDIKFGDEVEYEIKIMNANGAAQAQAPVFTDVLPKGLTLTNWTYQAGVGAIVDKKLTDWNASTNTLTSKYATNHNTNTLVTIKIKAKVAASGFTNGQTLTNTATVSASGVAAKSATANTVHYLPSHKITKAANNVGGTAVGTTGSKLSWNTEFFYDITYTNTSTKGFTDPIITDTLPVGIDATSQNVQYKLNGGATWTNHTGNLVSANGRTLNTGSNFKGIQPGKTLVIRIPVKATSAAVVQGKSFTNTVNATAKYSLLAATTVKNNVANVSGSIIVNYGLPNLTITKQVRNNTEKIPATGYVASTDIKFGDEVEYEIKIMNANGVAQAQAPVFTDVLPKGLTLTNWTYRAGTGAVVDKKLTDWNDSTNTLTTKYATNHNTNTLVTIKIKAKVAASGLTNGQTLTNTATISASGVAAKNATANTVHYLPNHKIVKVANDINGKVIGTAASKLDWPTNFYYDITYTNTSTKGVINPTIIDTLPTGIIATGQNIQFKVDNAATWTNDTNKLISADLTKLNTGTRFTGFNPGQTLTIRVPVKARDAASVQGKSVANTVDVTGKYSLLNATTTKNDVAKVTASVTVQYLVPNMSITKKVRNVTEKSPATGYASAVNLKPGDQLEYEITITNAANAGTAYAPKFEDVLPKGVTFNKWLYNGADKGTIGWNSLTNTLSDTYVGATGNHTPGRTVTILVQGTAEKTLADKQVLKNVASVSGSGVTKKEAEANVTNYLPQHSLKKEVSQKTIHQAEEFDYLLTYENQSSLVTSYISPVITDKLPETVKAKANTTKYSVDNGGTYKTVSDNVWSTDLTKIDTTGHLNIAIQSGKKLLIKFTVTSSAEEEKTLTNTAFVNGKFGLSNQTTSYPVKEAKGVVAVELMERQYYLNLRQVILNESPELVKPLHGYTEIQHQADRLATIGKNRGQLSMLSTSKDEGIQQSDFKRIELVLEQNTPWLKLLPITPEYYQYVGDVQSTKKANLATDHLSSKLIKQDILLDYCNEEEYWVTIYLTPQFAKNEESPRPYSWSSKINELGKIIK